MRAIDYQKKERDLFTYQRQERDDLVGPPLSLEQCKNLVPDSFVRNQLFRPVDRSKQKNPNRKYPPKLSDLQHIGLSRILLERFVVKTKTVPNNKQVPLYFVQQLFCEEFLHKQVNWDDRGASGGVALGRPADRKKAKLEGKELPRTKPIVLTQEDHSNISAFATEGVHLASQGLTAQGLVEQCRTQQIQIQTQAERIRYLEAKLYKYEEHFGVLPGESPSFTLHDLLPNPTVNLDDL